MNGLNNLESIHQSLGNLKKGIENQIKINKIWMGIIAALGAAYLAFQAGYAGYTYFHNKPITSEVKCTSGHLEILRQNYDPDDPNVLESMVLNLDESDGVRNCYEHLVSDYPIEITN